MKKKVLTTIMLITTILLVGCGAEETNNNISEQSKPNDKQEENLGIEENGENLSTQENTEELYEDSDNASMDESNTEVIDEVKETPWDGVYDSADVPGLADVDWELLNKWMYEQQALYGFEGCDIFGALGNDPRINNDWSELNSKFKTYYGNTDNEMILFCEHVLMSYRDSGYFREGQADYAYLYIEPYRSNTDDGVYGDVAENSLRNPEEYQSMLHEQMKEQADAVHEYELSLGFERGSEMYSKYIPFREAWQTYASDMPCNTKEEVLAVYNYLTENGYYDDSNQKLKAVLIKDGWME